MLRGGWVRPPAIGTVGGPNRVIAAFSPIGLSLNDATHVFHKALLAELVSGKHQRRGDTGLDAPPPANKPPESAPSLSSKQRATHARIVGRVRTHSPRMNPAAHADR